ncbi:uncharacterized protein LOC116301325 [Actinia tenebrosa]|uniref:Uncharacterized protein LOC116301325 n=1 Tax=Actinia tenebrosa TaxID=6105 RepID=A0A6P8II50_ACTTE|nr:uncharacterized protein LOC116301325 [Actinia tenebrosa]
MPTRKRNFMASTVSYSKRKKRRKSADEFPADRKTALARSDLGSYYDQPASWPEDFEKSPSLGSSSSAKKLGRTKEDEQKTNYFSVVNNTLTRPGLAIVDGHSLQSGLELSATCNFCGDEIEVLEDITTKHGLGAVWMIQCRNSECEGRSLTKTFPTSPKSGHFEVNRSVVLAVRSIGRGHSAAQKFCSIMGLPQPPNHSRWSEHSKVIQEKCKEILGEELQQSALELRDVHNAKNDSTVDVGVSLDDSGCTRGWSATDACVGVISTDTGKVVDVVHKTSSCSECKKMDAPREKGEVDKMNYLSWFLEHEPKCMLNHEGSSSAMEAAGAVELYQRSVEKNLRYIPFIGDGDSKAYSEVCQAHPYDPAVFIPKEECVSHVTKRMGTALRALTKECKGRKLRDGKGLTGKGSLTVKRIDKIQDFYGLATRRNKGDAKKMAKAVVQ